jgi:hypothetical protein
MNAVGSPDFQRTSIVQQQASWFERRYSVTLVILVATLLLTASALSRLFFDGRVAASHLFRIFFTALCMPLSTYGDARVSDIRRRIGGALCHQTYVHRRISRICRVTGARF